MPTRKKDGSRNAMQFLDALVGPLTIGGMLEAHRLCEEIFQAELARALGISRSHLNDIEKGRKAVSPARAAGFAERLCLSEPSWIKVALEEELRAAGLDYEVSVSQRPKKRKPRKERVSSS